MASGTPLRARAEMEARKREEATREADARDEEARNKLRAERVAPAVAFLVQWVGATVVTSDDLRPWSNSRAASVWEVEIDGFRLRVTVGAGHRESDDRFSLEQVSDDGKALRFIEHPWQLLEPWEKSHAPTNPGKGTT